MTLWQVIPLCATVSVRGREKFGQASIITFCTNFPAGPLVAEMEDELGVPIYDTVTMGVWGALKQVGVDTLPGRAWGRVFAR